MNIGFTVEQHSFLMGMSRVLDLSGTSYYLYSLRRTSPQTHGNPDALALASDWQSIGKDIWSACSQFSHEKNLASPEAIIQRETHPTADSNNSNTSSR